MALMRTEARGAFAARRDRASVTPARAAGPALTTVAVAAVVATLLVVLAMPWGLVLGAVALVALLGAVIGHRVTANLVAGVSLAAVRPYQPGERLRVFSPTAGRVVEAELVRTGALNTTLATAEGLLVVPNTLLFRAAPHA